MSKKGKKGKTTDIVPATTTKGMLLDTLSYKPRRIMFDIAQLRRRCVMDIADYESEFEGNVWECSNAHDYIYLDRGSDILAVAHLDTVRDSKDFTKVTMEDETIIYNTMLDDRLGAYIILDLLPKYVGKFDVLLTTGEETGQSTAQFFSPTDETRKYNWVFEFDRHGTDVVMYDFENDEMEIMLNHYGFALGYGSFSDICELWNLGCKAFNFGTGYYNEHAKRCYMELSDTALMVSRFITFYKEMSKTHLPHAGQSPMKWSTRSAYSVNYGCTAGLDYGDKWVSDDAYCRACMADLDECLCSDPIPSMGTAHINEISKARPEFDCRYCGEPVSLCICKHTNMLNKNGSLECAWCDNVIFAPETVYITSWDDVLCKTCGDSCEGDWQDTELCEVDPWK